MIKKFFFKDQKAGIIPLEKQFVSVGEGGGFDICYPAGKDRMLFTLELGAEGYRFIPGQARVTINGKRNGGTYTLKDCDRLEFENRVAIYLEERPSLASGPSVAEKAIGVLESVARDIGENSSLAGTLDSALAAIAKIAEAEEAYLISELGGPKSEQWSVLSRYSQTSPKLQRKDLISSTILNQAVGRRVPVYIESLIGHPMAGQVSLLGGQVFSIACLPLLSNERVFGAVYLANHTPGRAIAKAGLNELTVLATQIAMLLASRIELERVTKENENLREEHASPDSDAMIFASDMMSKLVDRLSKLAASELNLLITGETGTGKELIAKQVHLRSPRRNGPFIVVNCAAIPPALVESVLFGHTKGAYTGADKSRPGKFLQADQGTIFLDEIGELPIEVQVRLLRVLQEKQIEAVGSSEITPVDFRVVAATHRALVAAVKDKTFREDLYHRLNGATVLVPSLRERGDAEIILLAEFFMKRLSPGLSLSDEARRMLCAHSWTGNVRELGQVIARGAALSTDGKIRESDLELSSDTSSLAGLEGEGPLTSFIGLHKRSWMKKMAEDALHKADGNRAAAATALGVSERTLYRWLATDVSDSATDISVSKG
jgi:transcriptional regulator with GAF, ATPase, and Fis domain